ncbi:hypothetical protein [Nocardioides pinisoli]|uniref:Transposase n=1 Tax=Nocardioides pinisoli TaxID=2950279 RepID=A0ABT1KRJ2_9ACTN|nr:hypothetical protein [Nocardioides pinisoli]MCP3420349.1 hypothetical protein [Nocardioides pinisoli]
MDLREEADDLAELVGLTRAEVDAHFRVRTVPKGSKPRDFEEFAALPPGHFDPRVLQQATWWVDVLRKPHRITDRDDFPDAHLLAVIAMLRQDGWRWAEGTEAQWLVRGLAASLGDPPEGLLDGTPLMKALLTEARDRGLRVSNHD